MANQKSIAFVDYVLDMIHKKKDKGFGAKMKKADNETTEYQSWDILSRWIDLENEKDRKTYGLIGASSARSGNPVDGQYDLGKSLYMAFQQSEGSGEAEKSSSALRLRRLLACRDSLELIEIIRPVLRFLESKEISFSHAQILDDILWFDNDRSRERTRARWAQEFFGKKEGT